MRKQAITVWLLMLINFYSSAQHIDMHNAVENFVNLLDKNQKIQAQYSYDHLERYVWNYIPLNDRKGLSLNEMNPAQKAAAIALMKTALSDEGYKKATSIMQLEKVLKQIENRPATDNYRDTGKYYFAIFGEPSNSSIWGWRLDGHHLSLNFSIDSNKIVAGTPSFFGANPAVVLTGPQKGLEILKKENELSFKLLHLLNKGQLGKAMIDSIAPGDIITKANRQALIKEPQGISFGEMTTNQKNVFIQLLSLYIHRYTHLFAAGMMKDIETAGMEKLLFAWAGSTEDGPGHPRYYRIQGPTIIIEYDNTQNNGNHVHTIIRDLKNDFGGDVLLEHYKKSH